MDTRSEAEIRASALKHQSAADMALLDGVGRQYKRSYRVTTSALPREVEEVELPEQKVEE